MRITLNFKKHCYASDMKSPCVYMLASQKNGTLYIGMTTDLPERMWQHKTGQTPGFTSKYNVTRLVWFEPCDTLDEAYQRERSLKRYLRAWKIALIEKDNPNWMNLHPETGEYLPMDED